MFLWVSCSCNFYYFCFTHNYTRTHPHRHCACTRAHTDSVRTLTHRQWRSNGECEQVRRSATGNMFSTPSFAEWTVCFFPFRIGNTSPPPPICFGVGNIGREKPARGKKKTKNSRADSSGKTTATPLHTNMITPTHT